MNIFQLVFNIAIFLAAAWFCLPIILALIGMFLPFIGAAIVILVVLGILFK